MSTFKSAFKSEIMHDVRDLLINAFNVERERQLSNEFKPEHAGAVRRAIDYAIGTRCPIAYLTQEEFDDRIRTAYHRIEEFVDEVFRLTWTKLVLYLDDGFCFKDIAPFSRAGWRIHRKHKPVGRFGGRAVVELSQ